MLYVILEGHKGAGKSFIAENLKTMLSLEGYNVALFDETDIIKQCIYNNQLSVYELFGVREQKYSKYFDYDVLILEKSFISNIIQHLQHLPDDMLHEFITYELDHYHTFTSTCQVYTLFRDYSNKDIDLYLGLSHYLLETYALDICCLPNSQDENTDNLLKHICERIKWELDINVIE